ncbi:MAG: TonB-dependent receptor [Gemmatimonadetes bacterium]|nr:TonB-dependent receptor [Gemmatimonadota bacterium]
MILTALLLALQATTGTVHGTVRAHPSGEPVPHATVEVAALNRRAVADARGYYVIAGLPAGAHRVRAVAVGHDSASAVATLAAGGSVRLDLSLASRALALEAVQVAAAPPAPGRDAPGPAATHIDAATIKALPSVGEPDAFRAIQTLPSVAAASDFSTALYLRGGTPDQTLVTLDGVPLFNPYHLGGLFSAIDPDALATVDVVPGALPARAGDRLSGAVHMHTRDGGSDRWRSTGGISLISSRIGLDGPLPGEMGTMLFSVRRTYLDAAAAAARGAGLIDDPFPFAFTDAHLKLSSPAGGAAQWSVSGYLNDEGFRTPDAWTDDNNLTWGWGTRAASARYRRALGGRWLVDARAGASDFSGELTVGTGPGTPPERPLYSSMRNLMAALEATRYTESHRVSGGVELNAYRFAHDVFRGSEGDLARLLPHIDRVDRIGSVALHLTDEWRASERLSGRLGVRVLSVMDGATLLLPRAAARFGVTENLALTAGAGRYAQTLRSLRDEESLFTAIFAFDLLVAAPADRPSTSEDVTLGVEWASGATAVRADLFARRLSGLTIGVPEGDPLDTPLLVASDSLTGSGAAHGVELHATHRIGRRTFTLAYAWADASRTAHGETFTPRFHRPHSLDASMIAPLGRRGQFSARFQWASGQGFTPAVAQAPRLVYDPQTGTWRPGGTITVFGEHNSARLPAYRRLDLSIRREFRPRLARGGTLTPYFQVVNALASRNVLFATPGWSERGPVIEYGPQLPTIPTFGVEWTF